MSKQAAITAGHLFGRASLLFGHQRDAACDLMERGLLATGELPAEALSPMILALVDWLQPKKEHPQGAQLITDLTNAAASGDAAVMREAIERFLRMASQGGQTQ